MQWTYPLSRDWSWYHRALVNFNSQKSRTKTQETSENISLIRFLCRWRDLVTMIQLHQCAHFCVYKTTWFDMQCKYMQLQTCCGTHLTWKRNHVWCWTFHLDSGSQLIVTWNCLSSALTRLPTQVEYDRHKPLIFLVIVASTVTISTICFRFCSDTTW